MMMMFAQHACAPICSVVRIVVCVPSVFITFGLSATCASVQSVSHVKSQYLWEILRAHAVLMLPERIYLRTRFAHVSLVCSHLMLYLVY